MTLPAIAASMASLCFAWAVIWAGMMDVATMRIRNALVLFLVAAYAVLAPLAGFGLREIGASVVVAALVLAFMFVFFARGWVGGGDAKLAAAVALWIGVDQAFAYLVYTSLFGALLTFAILRLRAVPLPMPCLSIGWITRLHAPESGIPYGVAIASAALYVFPRTPWMTVLS